MTIGRERCAAPARQRAYASMRQEPRRHLAKPLPGDPHGASR